MESPSMKSNSVHTYVTGNSFPSIYGRKTHSMFGHITHIEYMTPFMQQRWPWMKGMWAVGDHKTVYAHFDTLEQARQYARKLWPECGFKTTAEYREEHEQKNQTTCASS